MACCHHIRGGSACLDATEDARRVKVRPSLSGTAIVSQFTTRQSRNRLIAGDVTRAIKKGRKLLVLTDRLDHADILADMLRAHCVGVAVLHGQVPRNEREAVRRQAEHGHVSAVVATGQPIEEGWDCPRLDTLFLATPFAFRGRLTQYLGRMSRTAPGKQDAIVIDYCDDNPMLWSQWRKRRETYDALEYAWLPAGLQAA